MGIVISVRLISMCIPSLPVIKMLSLSKEPGTIELRIMWVEGRNSLGESDISIPPNSRIAQFCHTM